MAIIGRIQYPLPDTDSSYRFPNGFLILSYSTFDFKIAREQIYNWIVDK